MGTSTSRYVRKKKTTKGQDARKRRLNNQLKHTGKRMDELNVIKK